MSPDENGIAGIASIAGQTTTGGRRWLFRALATALAPLLLLIGIEATLRLFHYGYSTAFFRSTIADGRRLIVQNDQFSWRFFPRQLARHPLPVSFSPAKPAGTYRIFVMGESAAMGDPEPAFGFSRVLEVLLRERFPEAHFEVINVAFTAINSHVILPIARDCAHQQGDLWIVYMGHNEVLGPFGLGTVFSAHRSRLWLTRTILALRTTKVGQLIEESRTRWQGEVKSQRTWHGLEMFLQNQIRQNDPRLESLYAQFRQNLEDMVRVARLGGTEVILCTPASNLRDNPPFASLHGTALSSDQKNAWEGLYDAGVKAESAGQFQSALDHFQAAAKLDPQFADLQFHLGRCALTLNQPDAARHSFALARDLDTLRFRTDSRLEEVIREEAVRWRGRGVFFCDTSRELSLAAPLGVPGDDFFFDHVHLNFEGNFRVARTIGAEIADRIPASLRRNETGQWADSAVCAGRLGLTDWNQYQMFDRMRRRLLEPPFTKQINHLARQQHYSEKLLEYRSALQPEALQAAVRTCRQALSHTPDDALLHDNLAKLLAAIGDNQAAIDEFRRVTELLPEYASVFSNIGLLLQKQGRNDEAEKYFLQSLARRPDLAEAQNGLGLVQAARGKMTQAIVSYRRALEDNPELVEARVNLGQALHRQGDLAEAETSLLEALRIRPNFAPAQLALGEVLLGEQKFWEAASQFAGAAQAQPESTLAHCRKGVQRQPNNANEYFKLANALMALSKRDEAMESLSTAVRLKTDFWQARYLLGVELAGQGRLAEAQEQLTAAIQLHPAYGRAHLNLGVTVAKQGHLAEAAAQFREALLLEPTNQLAREYLQTVEATAKPVH